MNNLSERDFWLLFTNNATPPSSMGADLHRCQNDRANVLKILQYYKDRINSCKDNVIDKFWGTTESQRPEFCKELILILLWLRTNWVRTERVDDSEINGCIVNVFCFLNIKDESKGLENIGDNLIFRKRGKVVCDPDYMIYESDPDQFSLTLFGERKVLQLLKDAIDWNPVIPEINASSEMSNPQQSTKGFVGKEAEGEWIKSNEAIKLFGKKRRSTFYRRVKGNFIRSKKVGNITYYEKSSVLRCKKENP